MDWLRSAARRAAKFARLGPAEQWLVIRTVGLLVRMRVALWVLPFKRVRKLAAGLSRRPVPRDARRYSAEDLTRLVSVGAAYVPEASCLTQALVADAMLKRYGYQPVLKIGVTRSAAKGFQAHAWIELDGKVVIGRVGTLDQYTPLPTLAPLSADK